MVTVTAQQVRDQLGLTSADHKCADEDVEECLDDACAWLGQEIDTTLDYTSCTVIQAWAIKRLAAIYLYAKATGGSAIGLTISIGGVSVSKVKADQVEALEKAVETWILRNKPIPFIVGEDRIAYSES